MVRIWNGCRRTLRCQEGFRLRSCACSRGAWWVPTGKGAAALYPASNGILRIQVQGAGEGWVGLGHSLCQRRCPPACVTFPHLCDWVPTSGCLVSQPLRLLTIPEPHQGAGEREMLPCLCVSVARAPGLWGVQGHRARATSWSGTLCNATCDPLGQSRNAWGSVVSGGSRSSPDPQTPPCGRAPTLRCWGLEHRAHKTPPTRQQEDHSPLEENKMGPSQWMEGPGVC